ncbi:MAG: hypothetical protein MUE78_07130 [Ilumatobacteraceae bacterium]|jgi:hypothetical protein|nr:hypothetical protein [Ilumatobacteraceae bacterium]
MLAAIGDTSYRIVLLLHIASAIVAFAPLVSYPIRKVGRVSPVALVLVGLFGIALVLLSDDAIGLGDPWVTASLTVWLIMNGVLHAVLLPAERSVAGGDASAGRIAAAAGAAVDVLLVVMLYLMIWQPGR